MISMLRRPAKELPDIVIAGNQMRWASRLAPPFLNVKIHNFVSGFDQRFRQMAVDVTSSPVTKIFVVDPSLDIGKIAS